MALCNFCNQNIYIRIPQAAGLRRRRSVRRPVYPGRRRMQAHAVSFSFCSLQARSSVPYPTPSLCAASEGRPGRRRFRSRAIAYADRGLVRSTPGLVCREQAKPAAERIGAAALSRPSFRQAAFIRNNSTLSTLYH